MSDLDDAIDALRVQTEADADRLAGQANTEINDAATRGTEQLLAIKQTLYSTDVGLVEGLYDRLLTDLFVDVLRPRLLASALQGLTLFADRAHLASNPAIVSAISSAVQLNTTWIDGVPAGASQLIEQQLGTAVIEPVSAVELTDKLRAKLAGLAAGQVKLLVYNTLHTMDQLTILKTTESLGADLYAYVGPDDVIARPFCHACVNQIFPVEALRLSVNGQIVNVLVSRGGYNCRHRLRPVLRAELKYLHMPLIDPYRMETVITTPAKGARPATFIRYPVAA